MSDWRIRKRYGHGAARVVLCPIPYREPACELTMLEGCRAVGPQMLVGARTGVMFGALIVFVFLFTALRDRIDLSQTQLLVWSDPIAAPIIEEPPPVVKPKPPVPVPAKPEPVVAKTPPKPVPVVKPKPPPVEVAKLERPKPKPKPKPKPILPPARPPKRKRPNVKPNAKARLPWPNP